jgi:hypothetical protein
MRSRITPPIVTGEPTMGRNQATMKKTPRTKPAIALPLWPSRD